MAGELTGHMHKWVAAEASAPAAGTLRGQLLLWWVLLEVGAAWHGVISANLRTKSSPGFRISSQE